MLYFVVSFVTLLGDVAETYGILLTLLIFMLTQKTLISNVYLNHVLNTVTSLNTMYNTRSFNKLVFYSTTS